MNQRAARFVEERQLDQAAETWQQVIEGGDEDAAPIAAEQLASLRLFFQNRPAEAEPGYAAAIASGHAQAAPRALAGLAEVRVRQERREEAESLVRKAADTARAGDSRVASLLGLVFWNLDQLGDSAEWYTKASADPDRRPKALVGLGCVRWKQGRREEAKALWGQATGMEDRRAAAQAFYNLGLELQAERKPREARAAYKAALDGADEDIAKSAAVLHRSLSRPWRALKTFGPPSVFLVLFLPEGWPQGGAFLGAALVLIALPVIRRGRRKAILDNIPIALLLAGMGVLNVIYGSKPWSFTVLGVAFAGTLALFLWMFGAPALGKLGRLRRRS
jgi:tetratricopeptide (TPR) repeat protein